MTDAWDLPAEPVGWAAGTGPGPALLETDGTGDRPARRRAPGPGEPSGERSGRRPGAPERRRPGAVAALVLILPPLVASLVSGGQGVVFWAGALLGAIGAALLCSRPGVWWVATSTPPVMLLMSVAGVVVGDSSAQTTKLGTDMAKVVAAAFPVMGVALVCAVAVGVGRAMSARQAKGNGRG